MSKIIAVIPIKHNSERVKNKNFRLLNNKPLFTYIIHSLLRSKYIYQIIIDTNSPIIKQKVPILFDKYFNNNKIIIYDRPEELSGGDVSTNLLLMNVIKKLELKADIFLHTHVTNPFLTTKTINKCIKKFIKIDKYDSLFTVNKFQSRFYDNKFSAINHNPEKLLPTQDLDPIYEENSCLYLIKSDILLKYGKRIGKNPYLYPLGKYESVDIDWEEDFEYADQLMKYMSKNRKYQKNNRKTVVITGCQGGIGQKVCQKFKDKGFNVIGIDKKKRNNITCFKHVSKYYNIDISQKDFTEKLKELFIKDKIYRIDILVNNAGVQHNNTMINTSLEDWDNIVNTNLKSIYLFCKVFYSLFYKTEIINIGSIHSIQTSEKIAIYAMTKGAISSLTRNMALEFGRDNHRVNCILPGAINTSMLKDGLKREGMTLKQMKKKHMLGKIGKPEEIANLVYYLSDRKKSGFIIGQNLIIDGGASIRLSTEYNCI